MGCRTLAERPSLALVCQRGRLHRPYRGWRADFKPQGQRACSSPHSRVALQRWGCLVLRASKAGRQVVVGCLCVSQMGKLRRSVKELPGGHIPAEESSPGRLDSSSAGILVLLGGKKGLPVFWIQ